MCDEVIAMKWKYEKPKESTGYSKEQECIVND